MPFNAGPAELIMILVVAFMTLALPVAVVLLLIRAGKRSDPDPRVTLADRLAKGEITREEFDTAMRALGYGEAPRAG
jgi:uncharacterized membrane protein